MVGPTIAAGEAEPAETLMLITKVGIKVMQEVLSTKKVIMAGVARDLSVLSDCKCSMALRPNGVAALPMPKKLAATFIIIAEKAGCPLGISGNSSRISGERALPIKLTNPDFSAIFISPVHRQIMPHNSIMSMGASSAAAKIASFKAPTSPEMAAKMMPAAIKINQNQLTIYHHPYNFMHRQCEQ